MKEEALAMLSFSFFFCPPSPFLVGSVGSAIVPYSLSLRMIDPTVETRAVSSFLHSCDMLSLLWGVFQGT